MKIIWTNEATRQVTTNGTKALQWIKAGHPVICTVEED